MQSTAVGPQHAQPKASNQQFCRTQQPSHASGPSRSRGRPGRQATHAFQRREAAHSCRCRRLPGATATQVMSAPRPSSAPERKVTIGRASWGSPARILLGVPSLDHLRPQRAGHCLLRCQRQITPVRGLGRKRRQASQLRRDRWRRQDAQ